MLKQTLKRVLSFCLITCMIFTSAELTNTSYAHAAEPIDGWNFEIYMCGSTLESPSNLRAATVDLLELMSAKNVPDNVQVTLQTGGSKAWHFDEGIKSYYKDVLHMTDETIKKINPQNISANYIQRYKIKYDNVITQDGKTITYPSLVQLSADEGANNPAVAKKEGRNVVSMADSSTLEDFVKDTVGQYKHNVLVFWDHGGGTEGGVCNDEWADMDSLSLKEIDTALTAASDVIPNGKYDMIGYDACLMGSFETLAMTARHADYATAAMTVEGDNGWNYTPVIDGIAKAVNENKDYSGKDIATTEVQAYRNYYLDKKNKDYDVNATIGAFDLSYMPRCVNEFDELAEAMMHICANSDLKVAFEKAAYTAKEVDQSMDLMGMYSFLNQTIKFTDSYAKANKKNKNATVKMNVANCNDYVKAAQTLKADLFEKDFLLAMCNGDTNSEYHGEKALSFFYPQKDSRNHSVFSKNSYSELGISDYYAAYIYNIAHNVELQQSTTPKSSVRYNSKTGKYTLTILSKNEDYMSFTGEKMYLKTKKGKPISLSENRVKLNGASFSTTPSTKYLTFNGSPLYTSAYDTYYGDSYTYMNVNGKEQKVFFSIEQDEVILENSFKPGTVLIPYYVYSNGKKALNKKATYKVTQKDFKNEELILPFKWKKENVNNFIYDFCAESYYGNTSHNKIDHSDIIDFTEAKTTIPKKTYQLTGYKITPVVTIKTGKSTLKKGKDYVVSYDNNLGIGKATITIKGIGRFAAAPEKKLTFKIVDKK